MGVAKTKTSYIALCGLFAALSAICSWIFIPLGFTPVPMNLATLAVFLAGGLLGGRYGAVSLGVYALAGAVGVPVFAGFRGGLGVLAGPTGGYIIGYIAAAFITGVLISIFAGRTASKGARIASYALAMVAGLAACYLLGTLWFMISTNTGAWAGLVSCVIPFLPGDAVKVAAGAVLVEKLRNFI